MPPPTENKAQNLDINHYQILIDSYKKEMMAKIDEINEKSNHKFYDIDMKLSAHETMEKELTY